jgi:hypothetical protein
VPVLVKLCMADLIDSLQTSQDFLRRNSLGCACGGAVPFVKSVESRRANRIACLVPRANDSDCLSNDWFAGMRFLRLRPMSMDARHEWQEGTPSPN